MPQKQFKVWSVIVSRTGWLRAELFTWQGAVLLEGIVPRLKIPDLVTDAVVLPGREPHDAARNQVVDLAQRNDVDVLYQLDDDMGPDIGFFDTSLRMIYDNITSGGTPIVVGSPYCTGGEQELPNVFRYRTKKNALHHGWWLDRYTREEAAYETGIKEVPNIGPAVIGYDMRAFSAIKQPYYEFIYADQAHITHRRSEDIHCHIEMKKAGVKLYCDWDHWAKHRKEDWVNKPGVFNDDDRAWVQERHAAALVGGEDGPDDLGGAPLLSVPPRGHDATAAVPDQSADAAWEVKDASGTPVFNGTLEEWDGGKTPEAAADADVVKTNVFVKVDS